MYNEFLQKYHKMWILIAILVIASSCIYWFYWDRPLMKGVHLNPYQVDEVQIVRRGEGILQEEIIYVRDKPA